MTPSCARLDDAAVYALGALPERECQDYARHLDGCEVCVAAVADMQHIVDCLPGAVPQYDAPRALRERLMTEVDREAELLRAAGPEADRPAPAPSRRGRRWLLSLRPLPAAALSSMLLALGIGGGVLIAGDEDPAPMRTVVASVDAAAAPAGSAKLHMSSSGSRLVVAGLPAPPEGRIYQVWLDHPDDGRAPEPTAVLFTVNRLGRASVDVPGDLGDVSAVLVTDEPMSGSSRPSSSPVITAQPA